MSTAGAKRVRCRMPPCMVVIVVVRRTCQPPDHVWRKIRPKSINWGRWVVREGGRLTRGCFKKSMWKLTSRCHQPPKMIGRFGCGRTGSGLIVTGQGEEGHAALPDLLDLAITSATQTQQNPVCQDRGGSRRRSAVCPNHPELFNHANHPGHPGHPSHPGPLRPQLKACWHAGDDRPS